MKYELTIDQLGGLLCSKASAANRETIKYYGADHPSFKNRLRFISQISLIRELGIPVEVATDGSTGKELYTTITISSQTWTV